MLLVQDQQLFWCDMQSLDTLGNSLASITPGGPGNRDHENQKPALHSLTGLDVIAARNITRYRGAASPQRAKRCCRSQCHKFDIRELELLRPTCAMLAASALTAGGKHLAAFKRAASQCVGLARPRMSQQAPSQSSRQPTSHLHPNCPFPASQPASDILALPAAAVPPTAPSC